VVLRLNTALATKDRAIAPVPRRPAYTARPGKENFPDLNQFQDADQLPMLFRQRPQLQETKRLA
jgi:hypothetical protein